MPQNPLFHPSVRYAFRLGRDSALVVNNDQSRVVALDSLTGQMLGAFQGAKTLEEHVVTAWQAGIAAEPRIAAAAVEKLITLGLMRELSLASVSSRVEAQNREDIDTIAIVTADRPALLARCLQSLTSHLRKTGRNPEILVVDGSERHQEEVERRVCTAHSDRGSNVKYCGTRQVELLRARLLRESIPPNVVDTALSLGPVGGNRNIAVLMAAGHRLLMIDDDILIEPWMSDEYASGLKVAGHVDWHEWGFFSSRHEALAGLKKCDEDLVSAHSSLLGYSISELALKNIDRLDLSDACSHLLRMISTQDSSQVRVSFTGSAGDLAYDCQYALMFILGPVRHLLMTDESVLKMALESRETRHIAKQLTVSHDPAAMGFCMAVANDRLVPPFMPFGRGEDAVFGAMLAFADQQSVFGHVPIGVVHDSERASAYQTEHIASASRIRLCDLLLAIVARAGQATFGAQMSQRLMRLGQCVTECAQLDVDDLRGAITDLVLGEKCRQIARLQEEIAGNKFYPDSWHAIFGQYRGKFEESVSQPHFIVPIECDDGSSLARGVANTHAFLRDFGLLLEWWPMLWGACERINRDERRLGANG